MKRASLLLALLALAACERPKSEAWQGYVEGEYVLLASPYAGQLEKLYVRRGDPVEAGKPVFALEQEAERAARAQAEEQLKSAQAKLENLEKARRAPEIAALREQVQQARAQAELSRIGFEREKDLLAKGYTLKPRVDEARSAYERDLAGVKQAQAQLHQAQLPLGRDEERKGAERDVEAAKAALAQADWRLEQKSVAAPVSGLVQDTFFVPGEWVPAGKPVASLLPPGNVKVRFYVPETVLGGLAPGQEVRVACDGCPGPFLAKVSYLSSQAEYTPPVLYSREQRAKLMYLVEARVSPAEGAKLRPGQPVDVAPK